MAAIQVGRAGNGRPPLSSLEAGVRARLTKIAAVIRAKAGHEPFHALVIGLVRHLDRSNHRGQLTAILRFIKSRVAFVQDPVYRDAVYPPEQVLELGAGDCDDMAVACGILAATIGFPVKLRAVSLDGDGFNHVYALALSGDAWFAMDPVYYDILGTTPPDAGRVEVLA